MMREILRNTVAGCGIAAISSSAFMVSFPLGLLVLGVFCLLVAVGDRLTERSQPGDRKRTR